MRVDHARALEAFRYLRDREEHTPVWATFLRAYNRNAGSIFDQLSTADRRRLHAADL